jgi:hypothetical protein
VSRLYGYHFLVRACAATVGLLLGLSAPAAAQTCLEQAVNEMRSANFAGALVALEACERAASFSEAELAHYYETLALVRFGTGENAAADEALARLAAIAPSHAFSAEAPPRVRERFAEVAATVARPALELEAAAQGDEVVISADVRDDPHTIVRRVRLFARAGAGAWSDREGMELRLRAGGERVEYYGVAEGLGGAVIAQAGDPQRPLTRQTAATALPLGGETEEEDRGGGSTVLYVVLIVAAVALVAGGITLGVVLGTQSSGNALGAPRGEGFP